jgi:hypothetical protein
MNGKTKPAQSVKPKAGSPVFGNNVDDVLTKKIIEHSADPAPKPAESKPELAKAEPEFAYRTPEQRRSGKAQAVYGIAALVCLGLLVAITYLWSKFREE